MDRIISFSIKNKLIILLMTACIVGFGAYSLSQLPIGAVPDITNNQVQVITTSRNLATEDVEKFLTYPVELEMANLPGVKEIRSVSKFGLSVVTVVFDDDMGTYLPRQLIAEKIKSAEERIPADFGKPFMGPVSTGLGEIYQYVLDVEPKYKDKYSVMELRTVQDWIVRRQLSGIPGVVEVNTWGGNLKQYEVAINPERLRAMNISIPEVMAALEKNNSVAGGSYIEKTNQSYFIRGDGLVTSLDDIRNIVVEVRNASPIYIRDIATVGFGKANRFGAITANGEGEKVLGQVMMLKDANSNAVIRAVKERVAEIQSALPEGVYINPILERSELIGRTTYTIAENLTLGCLIVIFVVVLLLGNFRSGLVVASVIPLCLLFALSLMYVFGVDANLMSLGAIDFGIIIDGAVIIVEFIAFSITANRDELMALPKKERGRFIDKITIKGANKMMHSAFFGQIIIIIVFIPILSLVDVEGKMFRPMALVFCFALLGAMLLCFTYVPVMASLFIRPSNPSKRNISNRLISFLENLYAPILAWALRSKVLVLSVAAIILVATVLLFSRMGGEFVPTLDEGDMVIQPVLKTGTSLTNTVEATTRMENILMTFPEVVQVVSRIGAAEVPTDPMSMEESDVIIKLSPRGEWKSAETKDELADEFKKALSIIPGVEYEFTQPIEMRFNELITGVKSDVAVKIFGENLDVLYNKALEVEKAIQGVKGASDIIVEKTAGLPQMTVKYNRQRIAKYGLNVDDLNKVISVGFAGQTAGTVFEGEKQFDLVLRYDEAHRQDIGDIENASVLLPNGNRLPLRALADISYTKGPAKISRDDTKRRIVVGINVRNRDMESVVEDVKAIIERDIDLPVGYTVEYGGQFENLQTARDRLMLAVPLALFLIFILLYFAFGTVRDALIIYSAIPLSAVGGVLLLYLRDMPFSISAGVGFIALFGIAVLNGIVLIEEYNDLKSKGIYKVNELILKGTRSRLRPVLLTAAAAALGFLPMAISTSAGAEVQRPLATVVVGGLVSATLLTLVVLPVLYSMFGGKNYSPNKATLLFGLLLLPFLGNAQSTEITMDQAVEIAIRNNSGIKASSSRIDQNRQLVGGAFNPDKTHIFYGYDESNLAMNNEALRVFGISQSLLFPSVYAANRDVLESQVALAEQQYLLSQRMVEMQVAQRYYDVLYWQSLVKKYRYLDSLYSRFSYVATRRFEQGESNNLERLTALSKEREIGVLLGQSNESVEKAVLQLQLWLQTDTVYNIPDQKLMPVALQSLEAAGHPGIQYYTELQQLSEQTLKLEKRKLLPDFQVSVFQGRNSGTETYMGYQAGVSVPLFFGAYKAKVNAREAEMLTTAYEAENYKTRLKAKYEALLSDLQRYQQQLDYYEQTGKSLSDELMKHAGRAFANGEIDFLQYVQLLENATDIEIKYLEALREYNSTALEANYLTN